jgi:hypothetical protein
MKEELLHYIWKNALYNPQDLMTTDNQTLYIIKHGDVNNDSGPDFFNAHIKINETVWAGNVEIHLRSSDWKRHGHTGNKVYDSVILHVVLENDEEITRTNGTVIPTLLLPVESNLLAAYELLRSTKKVLPVCKTKLNTINIFFITIWLERMLIERLENKIERVETVLTQTSTHWECTFYRLLSRSIGLNVNAHAFEILSGILPLQVLSKHKDSVFQLEALLFGQAGMLDDDCDDNYYVSLKKEYIFLKGKYSLSSMPVATWKFMRMRPANFPTIRLAQMAQLIHHSSKLLSKLIEAENINSITTLFDVEVSVYWLTHFSFGKPSNFSKKHIGDTAIQSIIINAIIPVLYLYGKSNANEQLSDKALRFLEQLPFENNEITRNWNNSVIDCSNAARSQALIHLYKNYCVPGNCLCCTIGDKLLRQEFNT